MKTKQQNKQQTQHFTSRLNNAILPRNTKPKRKKKPKKSELLNKLKKF